MLRFALGKEVATTPSDGHRAVALQNTRNAVFSESICLLRATYATVSIPDGRRNEGWSLVHAAGAKYAFGVQSLV